MSNTFAGSVTFTRQSRHGKRMRLNFQTLVDLVNLFQKYGPSAICQQDDSSLWGRIRNGARGERVLRRHSSGNEA